MIVFEARFMRMIEFRKRLIAKYYKNLRHIFVVVVIAHSASLFIQFNDVLPINTNSYTLNLSQKTSENLAHQNFNKEEK